MGAGGLAEHTWSGKSHAAKCWVVLGCMLVRGYSPTHQRRRLRDGRCWLHSCRLLLCRRCWLAHARQQLGDCLKVVSCVFARLK